MGERIKPAKEISEYAIKNAPVEPKSETELRIVELEKQVRILMQITGSLQSQLNGETLANKNIN